MPEARRAAAGLGIDLFTVDVKDGDYRAAFNEIEQLRRNPCSWRRALFSCATVKQVIDLAAGYKLPAMYEWPDQVEDGGLMAYGPASLRGSTDESPPTSTGYSRARSRATFPSNNQQSWSW